MRPPHYLAKNAKVESPTHLIFFDCETKPVDISPGVTEARFWFAWACYTRRQKNGWTKPVYEIFYDTKELWDWIAKHLYARTRLLIFAHNMGFDSSVSHAFDALYQKGYKIKNPILDDPPTWIPFYQSCTQCADLDKRCKSHGSLVLVDTLNWFRVPLSVLGDSVGLPKLEMPDYDADHDLWIEYAKRDVDVIRLAMTRYLDFLRSQNLGNFAKTLPGQAFAAFRHRFKKHDIFIDDNEKALGLARRGYVGGRTEAFYLGDVSNVYCYDINSMYPAVMQKARYPTKLVGYYTRVDAQTVNDMTKEYSVMVSCTVSPRAPYIYHKLDGRLVFPLGTFDTVLSTPEFIEAYARNEIKNVIAVARYENARLFTEYINFFWELRLKAKAQGDEATSYMAKLFLNSFYGKWGQSGRVFEDRETVEDMTPLYQTVYDHDTKKQRTIRRVNGLVQELIKEPESRDSHPAIAAHVTAQARLMLWDYIKLAGRENVYYTDTDSLFVNERGHRNLSELVGDNLGQIKLEWRAEHLQIRNLKDYSVDGRDKIKGVRKNAVQLEVDLYEQDSFEGLRGKIQRGDLNSQRISRITKRYYRTYHKGHLQADGSIKPFVLERVENA